MDTSRRRFFLWPCLGTLHFGWWFLLWNRVNLPKRVGYVKVVRIFFKTCWLFFGLNSYSSLYDQFWPQFCCMIVGGKIMNSHHAYNWNSISLLKFHSWKSSFFWFTVIGVILHDFISISVHIDFRSYAVVKSSPEKFENLSPLLERTNHLFVVLAGVAKFHSSGKH